MGPNSSGLADAAVKLGQDKVVMDHYFLFQQHKIGWFFSPNPNLAGATKRPKRLDSWNDWYGLSFSQKRVVAFLSGFKEDATDIIAGNPHLIRLKEGLQRWRNDLFCIPWGNKDKGTYTCNLFVGDAIYLWKKKSITNGIKHYYSPFEIMKGKSPLSLVKNGELQRGHIVVFGQTHMEIVTKTISFWIADDGFCSAGTGRSSREQTGTIKCDGAWRASGQREIGNSDNRYYSVV